MRTRGSGNCYIMFRFKVSLEDGPGPVPWCPCPPLVNTKILIAAIVKHDLTPFP